MYLHKWKELTFNIEVIGTVLGMPINITTNLPISNKYQYPFNDKEGAFTEFKVQNLYKKGVIKFLVMSQVNSSHQYFSERKVIVDIVLFLI